MERKMLPFGKCFLDINYALTKKQTNKQTNKKNITNKQKKQTNKKKQQRKKTEKRKIVTYDMRTCLVRR